MRYEELDSGQKMHVNGFISKQKMLFLELDGHDYHKTKDQRINDSIKKAIATNEGLFFFWIEINNEGVYKFILFMGLSKNR